MRMLLVIALTVVALLVLLSVFFAAQSPDGLERVATSLGFMHRARRTPYVLLPDYVLPGFRLPVLGRVGAGLLGAGLVFGLAFLLAALLRRRRRER